MKKRFFDEQTISILREDNAGVFAYNECSPHSALNYQTPSEFAARRQNGKCEGKQTDITNDGCISYWGQVAYVKSTGQE